MIWGGARTLCLTSSGFLLSNPVWSQGAGGIMQTTEGFVLYLSIAFTFPDTAGVVAIDALLLAESFIEFIWLFHH